MPAGAYRLTFGVPEIRVGTDIYFAFNDTYNFTVEAAPLDEAWVADLTAKLVRAEYRYNGETQLYNEDNTDLLVWSDAVKSTMNPDRTGVWGCGRGIRRFVFG